MRSLRIYYWYLLKYQIGAQKYPTAEIIASSAVYAAVWTEEEVDHWTFTFLRVASLLGGRDWVN